MTKQNSDNGTSSPRYEINDMFLESGVAFDGTNTISHFSFCGVEYTVSKEPDRMTVLVISADSPYHKSKYEAPFSDLAVRQSQAAAASSSAVAADLVDVDDEEYWQMKRRVESEEVILVYPGKDLMPPQDVDDENGTRPLSEEQLSNLKQRLETMLGLYREVNIALLDLVDGSNSGKIRAAERFFVDRGLKPEELQGCKALHDCIIKNATFVDRAVKVLVSLGVGVNKHFDGRSPMVLAAANGNLGVCKALLEAGADPNSHDYMTGPSQYLTALHAAMMQQKFDVAILLISKGARYNLASQDQSFLAAFAAIKNNDSSSLERIIQQHPVIVNMLCNWSPKDGLLHYAVKNRADDKVFDVLKRNGANLEIGNGSGNVALALACNLGNFSAVSSLVDRGANVDACNQNSDSILHIVASAPIKNRYAILRKIISKSPEVNVVNRAGKTPFQLLVESKGDYESGCVLLDEEATFNKKSAEVAPYVAVWAARRGKLKLLEDVFRSHPKTLGKIDANFEVALIQAATISKRSEIFELLAKKRFNLNDTKIPVKVLNGSAVLASALHALAIDGHVEVIENFVRIPGIDVNKLDEEMMTPLQRVVESGSESSVEIVRSLIRNGADVSRVGGGNIAPLFFAICRGDDELIMALLDSPTAELLAKGSGNSRSNETLIGAISSDCSAKVLKKLLEAASSRKLDPASLVRFDMDESAKDKTFPAIYCAILSARRLNNFVVRGDFEQDALRKVIMLLDCGADINFVYNNQTLVHLAASSGAPNIVKYLLDRGLSVDGVDSTRFNSPLHEVMTKLFSKALNSQEAKSSEQEKSPRGEDLGNELHKENLVRVIRTLVENGADINAVGPDGTSPYSIAAKNKEADPAIFDYLTMISRAGSSVSSINIPAPKPSPESASASPRSIKSSSSTKTPS